MLAKEMATRGGIDGLMVEHGGEGEGNRRCFDVDGRPTKSSMGRGEKLVLLIVVGLRRWRLRCGEERGDKGSR